jgi:2-polyprenyl-3-methyl-5-hydroxy-6-metoxy-1,4-benzoquinol methylase
MQYEPIKKSLGRFFAGSLFLRKTLYFLLDLLLLRTWHVKRALKKIRREYNGEATVLDAGSGFGQYTWRMSRMSNKWKISAIDINSEQINDCNSFFGKTGLSDRVSFQTGDLTLLQDTDCYDIILSVDVMEHIEEDLLVFKNFYRSLNKNGVLVISTPSDPRKYFVEVIYEIPDKDAQYVIPVLYYSPLLLPDIFSCIGNSEHF